MGLGQHLMKENVRQRLMTKMLLTLAGCRFGNFHFKFAAFHMAKAQETAASLNIFFNMYNFLNY